MRRTMATNGAIGEGLAVNTKNIISDILTMLRRAQSQSSRTSAAVERLRTEFCDALSRLQVEFERLLATPVKVAPRPGTLLFSRTFSESRIRPSTPPRSVSPQRTATLSLRVASLRSTPQTALIAMPTDSSPPPSASPKRAVSPRPVPHSALSPLQRREVPARRESPTASRSFTPPRMGNASRIATPPRTASGPFPAASQPCGAVVGTSYAPQCTARAPVPMLSTEWYTSPQVSPSRSSGQANLFGGLGLADGRLGSSTTPSAPGTLVAPSVSALAAAAVRDQSRDGWFNASAAASDGLRPPGTAVRVLDVLDRSPRDRSPRVSEVARDFPAPSWAK